MQCTITVVQVKWAVHFCCIMVYGSNKIGVIWPWRGWRCWWWWWWQWWITAQCIQCTQLSGGQLHSTNITLLLLLCF